MRFFLAITLLSFFVLTDCYGQKSKRKKDKSPNVIVYGDSLRTDSVVYYETEIGFILPDHSSMFKGRWHILVMKRQARANPDSLVSSYLEFNGDTLFTAVVGCTAFSGNYIIKGPTIKFKITDTSSAACLGEVEQWFARLIQERVSYFGVDEKILYLKDGAFNIVFDCAKKTEETTPR
jgi:heat shock protein HslJ